MDTVKFNCKFCEDRKGRIVPDPKSQRFAKFSATWIPCEACSGDLI